MAGKMADHYGDFFARNGINHTSAQIWKGFVEDKGLVFFVDCSADGMDELKNVFKNSLSKNEKKKVEEVSPLAFMTTFTDEQRATFLVQCSKCEGWVGTEGPKVAGALTRLAHALNKENVDWDPEKLPTTMRMLFLLMKEHKRNKNKGEEEFINEKLKPIIGARDFAKMRSVKTEAKAAHSRKATRLGGDDSAFKSDLQEALENALEGIVTAEYDNKNLEKLVKAIKPVVSELVSANAPTSTTVQSIVWCSKFAKPYKGAGANMRFQIRAPEFWNDKRCVVLIGHENVDNSNVKRRVLAEMQVIIHVLQEFKTVQGVVSEGKAQFLKDLLSTVLPRPVAVPPAAAAVPAAAAADEDSTSSYSSLDENKQPPAAVATNAKQAPARRVTSKRKKDKDGYENDDEFIEDSDDSDDSGGSVDSSPDSPGYLPDNLHSSTGRVGARYQTTVRDADASDSYVPSSEGEESEFSHDM